MKQEFQDALFQTFPKIFRDKDKSCQETCMCWGIECRDGWYNLIFRLCDDIQTICNKAGMDVVATQVKEKYGTLRFYYCIENYKCPWYLNLAYNILPRGLYWKFKSMMPTVEKKISNLVWDAEITSSETCENCGSHKGAKSRTYGSWVATLCGKCHKKRKENE